MPNVRLTVEYDGTNFFGWQVQPGHRTIEESLRKALEMVLREPIPVIYASGRTDSGVHARGQVVNFHVSQMPDLGRLALSISFLFRGELSVVDACFVDDDFHARHSAKRKQYSYLIFNRMTPPTLEKGRVWFVTAKLDFARMQSEAAALIGNHDFTSFRGAGCAAKSPEREIFESEFVRDGNLLCYRVVGSGFLRHMVRTIVGTLVGIGRGVQHPDSITELLAARDRKLAGPNAPAHGLYLDWVGY